MGANSVLLKQLQAIRPRLADAVATRSNIHFTVCDALNRARSVMINELEPDLVRSVELFTAPVLSSLGDPPYPEKGDVALLACDQLIGILEPTVRPPSTNPAAADGPINRIAPDSRAVFIVHGHDEANLLRLKGLLKERFELQPVVLMEEASAGETVIEKFERIASKAAFCLVLMTPDDQIGMSVPSRAQARPNAVFELGWFYGRMGRSRVCILLKRGTEIHSDLAGIVRIEFIERIDEAVVALERELSQAGLLGR